VAVARALPAVAVVARALPAVAVPTP